MNDIAFYDVTSYFLIESYRRLRQMLFLHLQDMREIFYLIVNGSVSRQDCLVGIVTYYGLVGSGIESWYCEILHADSNGLQSEYRVFSRGTAAEGVRAILPPPLCACIGMSLSLSLSLSLSRCDF
jgi:hypothetical protein